MTKLTKKQEREVAAIAGMPDDQIDLSDIPEVEDSADFIRGRFYRPVTRPITIRMNAPDVAIAQKLSKIKGLKYQTYIKSLLHDVLERERASVKQEAATPRKAHKKRAAIDRKAQR